MTTTNEELKPEDKVCWMQTSPRSARTMSARRREGTLVQHKENGISEVRISKGKVIEVETAVLRPISADPLRNLVAMLAGKD
jgi:hypothetical protein